MIVQQVVMFYRIVLVVIVRTMQLSGWKAISQSLSHLAAASRSSWRLSQSLQDLIVLQMMLSLENSLSWLDFKYSGKSFIYTRKRTGSKTVPCGTPEVTGAISDDSIQNHCLCTVCTKFLNQYSFICSKFYKLYKYIT